MFDFHLYEALGVVTVQFPFSPGTHMGRKKVIKGEMQQRIRVIQALYQNVDLSQLHGSRSGILTHGTYSCSSQIGAAETSSGDRDLLTIRNLTSKVISRQPTILAHHHRELMVLLREGNSKETALNLEKLHLE
jgi:hypothetical protein